MDRLFGIATGWLGWPPDVAWRTPVPEILIAMDARIEWARPPVLPTSTENPAPAKQLSIADRLRAAFAGRK